MPQTIQLLILCWLLMLGIAHEWSHRAAAPWSWRVSVLFASVAWGTTVVAITEVLSLLHLFQREALLMAWIGVFLIGGLLYGGLVYRRGQVPFALTHVRLVARPFRALPRWKVPEWQIVWPSRSLVLMLVLIGFQVLTLAMAAYQFAPNNWDSMTYHLARVVHWQQAQSVAHYATHIDRQIQMPPFASFVTAHLHTLTVGDQFVNLVQWGAMVLCLVGVAEIAGHLGADRTRQVIAVLLCVSIPMGILQATSTQNDYVVAAWLVGFVALGMNLLGNVHQWSFVIGTGLALGLALLTKASAFVYAPPFVLVLGLGVLYRLRRAALARGVVVLVVVLAVNAGHFTRNMQLYGSPTGPRSAYRNDIFGVNVLASNLIRSTAMQMALHTGIPVLDTAHAFTMGWLRLLHEFTGLDPLDPRTTHAAGYWPSPDMFSAPMSFDEDYASNPLHAVLIIVTMSVGTIGLWNRRQYQALGYMGVVVAAFFLFCGYLTLDPWRVRLHLPVFVLWCPVIAVALFRTDNRLIRTVPIIVALFGFTWTFQNNTRPISPQAAYAQHPRTDGYFTKQPGLLPVYRRIADTLGASGCSQVGLIIGGDTWEYPLWMLLRERHYFGALHHIRVQDPSRVYERTDVHPCAVIAKRRRSGYTNWIDHYLDGSAGQFYLYMDPATAPAPVDAPAGVTVSSAVDVGVLLGTGWYDFEPEGNVRWMQGHGRLWLYAETATGAVLQLRPYRMHDDGSFGVSGEMLVTLNEQQLARLTMTADSPVSLALPLAPGFNRLDLRLAAGDFVPAESDPDNGDRRRLGIAFYPLTLMAPHEASRPAGFHLSSGLHVLPGTGWYDFEPGWNVRWMQADSDLWVYAEEATGAVLQLRPHVMHVDQTFGTMGQMTVTLNATERDVITTTTGITNVIPLQLEAGWNRVALAFGAGDFVPAATVPPLNSDERHLAIAFAPMVMTTVADMVQPAGFEVPADVRVLPGAGWYDFEPGWNVRWMQERGELWIYTPDATAGRLTVQPHVMHVDQTFGSSGVVRVTINQTFGGEWGMEAGVRRAIPVHLNRGWNKVVLEFLGGTFRPEGDGRSLGIAFYPIEITTAASGGR